MYWNCKCNSCKCWIARDHEPECIHLPGTELQPSVGRHCQCSRHLLAHLCAGNRMRLSREHHGHGESGLHHEPECIHLPGTELQPSVGRHCQCSRHLLAHLCAGNRMPLSREHHGHGESGLHHEPECIHLPGTELQPSV